MSARAFAQGVLDKTGKTAGHCLVLGAGDGQFLHALAARSELMIHCVEPDPDRLASARRSLDAAGLYGVRVVLHITEIGTALAELVDGDSWLLDGIFSHVNLVSSEAHEHLIERARDGLHQRYVTHYLERASARQQRDRPGDLTAAAAVLLQAGHLAQTGVVSTDIDELADAAGRPDLLRRTPTEDDLEGLRSRSRGGGTVRLLPTSHPRPEAFDDFLLFVREARW